MDLLDVHTRLKNQISKDIFTISKNILTSRTMNDILVVARRSNI